MTARPLLTRAARLACPHPQTAAILSTLPNSYDGRQWCRECGAFFSTDEWYDEETGEEFWGEAVDWPATEAADREQQEREGQMRLPEE